MTTEGWIFMVGFRVFDVGLLIVWLVWFFRLRDDDDPPDDDGPGGGGHDPGPGKGPGGGGLGRPLGRLQQGGWRSRGPAASSTCRVRGRAPTGDHTPARKAARARRSRRTGAADRPQPQAPGLASQ